MCNWIMDNEDIQNDKNFCFEWLEEYCSFYWLSKKIYIFPNKKKLNK